MIGKSAPGFTLKNQDNNDTSLQDFKGKWVILYFYPKDNTSGCTLEAIEFTAAKDEFSALNAEILGVSRDSVKTHCGFIEKQNLGITLLSDPEHEVHELYGAWGEKKMYGKPFMGALRSTFIIDPDGIVKASWSKVKVKGHVETLKAKLQELQA